MLALRLLLLAAWFALWWLIGLGFFGWLGLRMAHARMTLEVAQEWEGYHLTPAQREWFSSARGSFGGCCDVADGHPADDWERRADADGAVHYWALYRGKWWKVTDGNVIHKNPIGVPVIWLTTGGDAVRCLAPGPEN